VALGCLRLAEQRPPAGAPNVIVVLTDDQRAGSFAAMPWLASQLAQENDLLLVDGIRNNLFGPPGAGGTAASRAGPVRATIVAMSQPILFLVDERPEVLEALAADLSRRFGTDHRVLAEGSPGAALEELLRLAEQREEAERELVTLGEALERHPAEPRPLAASSWGEGKDVRTWDSPEVADLAWAARRLELRVLRALRSGVAPAALERAARELLAVQAPEGLLGIHVNMPGTVPQDILRHLRNFDPAPAQLSDREKIDVEAGSYAALPKNVPHGFTVRSEQVRLLVTVEPAGAEYFFVPRDDSDADPAKFGLIIHAGAPAM
jgi:hypothetical protein